jgi:hypothetical protein
MYLDNGREDKAGHEHVGVRDGKEAPQKGVRLVIPPPCTGTPFLSAGSKSNKVQHAKKKLVRHEMK